MFFDTNFIIHYSMIIIALNAPYSMEGQDIAKAKF
jgi:hypothetical protein